MDCSPGEVGAGNGDADPEVPWRLVHDRLVFDSGSAFEGFATIRAGAVGPD